MILRLKVMTYSFILLLEKILALVHILHKIIQITEFTVIFCFEYIVLTPAFACKQNCSTNLQICNSVLGESLFFYFMPYLIVLHKFNQIAALALIKMDR